MADRWKVTNQRQTTTSVAGQYVDAVSVTFQTTNGDTGTVVLPLTGYTADAVNAAIDARVDVMEQVAKL